ncbi:unnamed protein product [Cochlearia groenlandica]
MSRMQDPSRGFLHRGNHFKILLHPKKKNNNNAHLYSNLLSLFEKNLTVSIRELIPKDKNHILTVTWMIQAMESLCKTHKSIGTLVKDLEIQESDLEEENMIRMYSDISLKILELCNAFALELDHLNHCNLLLKFALSKVELDLSYLESWKQHMVPKNSRIGNYGAVLSGLFESIRIPKKAKKKHSAKEKVLLRALYGVKVKTLYILSVLASAFSGSSENLFYITLSPKEIEGLPWAKPFMELQNMINPEIKNRVLYDRFNVIRDLEDVETDVKKLYKVVVEEGSILDLVEPLKKSVKELSTSFDLVSKEIHCLLKIVISARNTLSERLLRKYTEEMGVTLPMMSKSIEICFVNREKHFIKKGS